MRKTSADRLRNADYSQVTQARAHPRRRGVARGSSSGGSGKTCTNRGSCGPNHPLVPENYPGPRPTSAPTWHSQAGPFPMEWTLPSKRLHTEPLPPETTRGESRSPSLSKSINAAANFVAPQGINGLFSRPLRAALCDAGCPALSGHLMPRAPRRLLRRGPREEIPNRTAFTRAPGPRPSGSNPPNSREGRVRRRRPLRPLRQADPSARRWRFDRRKTYIGFGGVFTGRTAEFAGLLCAIPVVSRVAAGRFRGVDLPTTRFLADTSARRA